MRLGSAFLLDDGRGLWRIPSLDGLRGIAALMVLASHAYQYSELHIPVLGSWILGGGQGGVMLFFVLSGFLLYVPWVRAADEGRPPPSLRTFAIRRVLRIVPAYWVCFLVIAVITAVTATQPAMSTIVLHAVFLPLFSQDTLLSAFWSLQVEWYFYFSLPVLAIVFAAIGARRGLAACVALAALWFVAVVVAAPRDQWFALLTSTPFYLAAFACGMVAAVVWSRSRTGPHAAWLVVVGLVAYLAISPISGPTPGAVLSSLTNLALAPFAAAAVLGVAQGGLRQLAHPAMRVLGAVSYSLYLWHLYLIKELPLGVALALVAPVTLASFFFVERPFLRMRPSRRGIDRGLAGSRVAEPAAAVQPR